eukprot:TRINITY_DN4171_c0_g1_i1.p1 TRINITY_DN4171_c0_g1~~TRINITY_DN4171_c0_g1_i1.p1  ORF type:complete len:490 (+),score=94.69 TRINITY_DN4171_c0_g1_i1:143-1612(+)
MASGSDIALRVQGREGRWSMVNTVFEPSSQLHNGRPNWVSRGVASLYIFHTGQARWVISRRLDDNNRCYAFMQDDGAPDPAHCSSDVVFCDEDGEWRVDQDVSIVPAQTSNDPFVQLRMTLDRELDQFGLNDVASLRSKWRRLDFNGNGIVSLAEIDKFVVEMVAGGSWPSWLNNKPALMRAYKKTIHMDGNGDDWVQTREFHALLLNIFWFNKLWNIFDNIDGDDRRIDLGEFCRGMGGLGLHLSQAEAAAEFNKIDTNHGGQVLFVEFCAYVRKRVNPDTHPHFDADIISGTQCGKTFRKQESSTVTLSHFVEKKNMSEFDETESKIKRAMHDIKALRSMWNRMDFNGNRIVSLAEIDKWVVENYPVLNHKPALMRAYKSTINAAESNGDDWVQKKEFKRLLGSLFYFNKIFWLFDNVDGDKDRRLNYEEFKRCLTISAGSARMSEQEMRSDFGAVDRNGGGIILFDEFCMYFTQKACPECLQDMVE